MNEHGQKLSQDSKQRNKQTNTCLKVRNRTGCVYSTHASKYGQAIVQKCQCCEDILKSARV